MTTLNSSGQCQKRTRPLNFGIRQAKNERKLSMSLHVTDLVSCTNHTYWVRQNTGFLCSCTLHVLAWTSDILRRGNV